MTRPVPKTIFDAIRAGVHARLQADFHPQPAREPTDAPPGSREKLDAMCRRVARGEELFHSEDKPDYESEG